MAAAACGKKGPPLAPIVRVPGAVQRIEARRIGSDVYLTVTVPAVNIDSTAPADLERIDVFGYTGREAPGARFLEGATLVATIPVAPIPRDGSGRPQPAAAGPRTAAAPQGTTVTVRDTLEGDELEARVLPPRAAPRGPAAVSVLPTAAAANQLHRFYAAIGVSDRNRSGPQSTITSLPLGPLSEPPAGLIAEYTPDLVRLNWEPSGGLLGFILDGTLPPEPSPVEDVATPAVTAAPFAPIELLDPGLPLGPTRYNVYREVAPDPLALPESSQPAPWRTTLPQPLNTTPLTGLTFDDPIAIDGRERCYQVRAVRGSGPSLVESNPSPRICFTPVDTVPPATPTGLMTEAADGAINLIWEPNIEEDLAGYMVLRGAPGDATLTALTLAPVRTARFVDRTVVPGTRYAYAVVAVDDRVPLGNPSAESDRTEETAR